MPAVSNKIPAYLRLHVEQTESVATIDSSTLPAEEFRGLADLCASFQKATGFSLTYTASDATPAGDAALWSAPIEPEITTSPGRLSMASEPFRRDPVMPPADVEVAGELAQSICGLLGEMHRTRHALWLREAELAASIPVAPRRDEEVHFAQRLQSVLQGGAEAVDCQAAALYVLDDSTSTLKLRAAWGLPKERLIEPARLLDGAVGDIEALAGHAVVIEDTDLLPHWRVPEKFASAVCVPVSSPTSKVSASE